MIQKQISDMLQVAYPEVKNESIPHKVVLEISLDSVKCMINAMNLSNSKRKELIHQGYSEEQIDALSSDMSPQYSLLGYSQEEINDKKEQLAALEWLLMNT